MKLGNYFIKDFDAGEHATKEDFLPFPMVPEQYRNTENRFYQIATDLYTVGGSIFAHGLSPKPECNLMVAMQNINAMMHCDDIRHDIMICTIAWALDDWFDVVENDAS